MTEVKIHEIGKEFYFIKSSESDLHRNIFVKRFIGNQGESRYMVMDPGTKLDLPILLEALKKLTGGIQNLNFIFLSHQDPDVTANINMVMTSAPRAIVLASIDTWRLVKMYGLPENRFLSIESLKTEVVKIKKTGHDISFIPTPFAHFKGAVMYYDFESKVLFSGDLLAGLNTRSNEGIYADEGSWKGIALFHQIYIPSSQVLRNAIGQIGMMKHIPEVIAPQHGDILKGPIIKEFLDRLLKLEVGIDIIDNQKAQKDLILLALNDFLDKTKKSYPQTYNSLLQELTNPGDFTTLFTITSGMILEVKVSLDVAVNHLWDLVCKLVSPDELPVVGASLVSSLEEFSLTTPEKILQQIPSPVIDEELFT